MWNSLILEVNPHRLFVLLVNVGHKDNNFCQGEKTLMHAWEAFCLFCKEETTQITGPTWMPNFFKNGSEIHSKGKPFSWTLIDMVLKVIFDGVISDSYLLIARREPLKLQGHPSQSAHRPHYRIETRWFNCPILNNQINL